MEIVRIILGGFYVLFAATFDNDTRSAASCPAYERRRSRYICQ